MGAINVVCGEFSTPPILRREVVTRNLAFILSFGVTAKKTTNLLRRYGQAPLEKVR